MTLNELFKVCLLHKSSVTFDAWHYLMNVIKEVFESM